MNAAIFYYNSFLLKCKYFIKKSETNPFALCFDTLPLDFIGAMRYDLGNSHRKGRYSHE